MFLREHFPKGPLFAWLLGQALENEVKIIDKQEQPPVETLRRVEQEHQRCFGTTGLIAARKPLSRFIKGLGFVSSAALLQRIAEGVDEVEIKIREARDVVLLLGKGHRHPECVQFGVVLDRITKPAE